MIVVSNTSPLIALSKINQLVILSRLFEKILIPQLVIDEFLVNCLETEGNALTHFCQSDSVNTVHVEMNKFFSRRLGTGEQAVLSLALQKQVETVLIDDRKAFNEAKALGLMPISTRAILRVAVQREIINDLAGLENQLQTKQFFLPHY